LIPIAAFLVVLYIRPQDWFPTFIGWPANYIVVALLLLVGLVRKNRRLPQDYEKYPPIYFLCLYVFSVFMSNVLNSNTEIVQREFTGILKQTIVFLVIVWNVDTMERIQKTFYVMLAITVFLGVHAIIQGSTGVGIGGCTLTPGYTEIRVRWWGDWDGPNVFAILFLVSIPIALELIFGSANSVLIRILGTALAALFIYSIILTNSRGALLALAVTILSYFLLRFRFRWAIIAGICGLFAIIAFAPSRISNVSSGEQSAHQRVYGWERGLVMFRENPIFGIGKGEFAKRSGTGLIAHNNYVQFFAETGIVGYFSLMAVFWYSVKGLYFMWKGNRNNGPGDNRSIPRILLSIFLAQLSVTFFVVMENDLLFFLMGIFVAAIIAEKRRNPDFTAYTFGKKDLAITGAVMVAIYAMVWVAAIIRII
jgi:hypothetical protein